MNDLDPRYLELYNNAPENLKRMVREKVFADNQEEIGSNNYDRLVITSDKQDVIQEQNLMIEMFLNKSPRGKEVLAMISLRNMSNDVFELYRINVLNRYLGVDDGRASNEERANLENETLNLIDFIDNIKDLNQLESLLYFHERSRGINDNRSLETQLYETYLMNNLYSAGDNSLREGVLRNMLSEQERSNNISDVREINENVMVIFNNMEEDSRIEVILSIMQYHRMGTPLNAEKIANMVLNKSLENFPSSNNFLSSDNISFDKIQEMQESNNINK